MTAARARSTAVGRAHRGVQIVHCVSTLLTPLARPHRRFTVNFFGGEREVWLVERKGLVSRADIEEVHRVTTYSSRCAVSGDSFFSFLLNFFYQRLIISRLS